MAMRSLYEAFFKGKPIDVAIEVPNKPEDRSQKRINIQVNINVENEFNLIANESTTVGRIRKAVCNQIGLSSPAELSTLLFARTLNDTETTLGGYGIQGGTSWIAGLSVGDTLSIT
jgi:hypothetical protein